MALYGYKISNFTKAKKYAEIEALLDKKLKGFEKQSYEFEKDGSVRQDYVRKNEDGTETTVTLAKNITESSIVVFSDIPLKFLRNGGWCLLTADILPTLIFTALYWFGMNYIVQLIAWAPTEQYISFLLIAAVIMLGVDLIAAKLLMRRRSLARTLWIETAGIFSLPIFFWILFKVFAHVTLMQMLKMLLYSPLPVIIISGALTFLILKLTGRK